MDSPSSSSTSYDSQEEKQKQNNKSFKKQWRKQKFNEKWLTDEKFKGWLEKFPDDEFKCRCAACNKDLNCGKSDLEKHNGTKKHQQNISKLKNTQTVNSFFKTKSKSNSTAVDNFVIRLSMFFAEHNVATQIVDHLLPLLKELAPDSNIIKEAKLGRTKCAGIIKNVLAQEELNCLVETLKTTQFSVMVDESTDIGTKKTMCILVRYINPENGQICVKLLDLMTVGSDCTAAALYENFKSVIYNFGIPFKNIIGFCSDGANVMMGAKNSFSSRLTEDNTNVITIKCICHSAAIVASKACLALPRAPEELLRQIGVYISSSSKRCSQLQEIQSVLGEEQLKIIKTSATRWLSHQKCVERILENWEVLQVFFTEAVKTDKLKSTETILQELKNMCTRAYLFFLKYVLEFFNLLNAMFQSKKALIHQLHSESVKIFMNLGQNFIKREQLKTNVNVRSPHIFLELKSIYLGPECMEFMKQIPESESNRIRLDCLEFYIVALEQIQKRLPIGHDSVFKEMFFLNPKTSLGMDGIRQETAMFSFTKICEKISIDQNKLSVEWRIFPNQFSEVEKAIYGEYAVEKFWWIIYKLKFFNDDLIFPEISKIAFYLLSLPHANADAERIFSVVTDVKNKKRNKLSNEVLNAICIIRSSLSNNSGTCLTFRANKNHFSRMSGIYD